MRRWYHNYWVYSVGLAIVWAIGLSLARTMHGGEQDQTVQLVFYGYCLGWISTTIARYIYPPPKRWGKQVG